VQCQAHSGEETEAFGGRLARSRPAGNALAVLYLSGELGAGKTTLARGFLHACGIEGLIRSPSYALFEIHETAHLSILHADLFRLREPGELEALGLRDWARAGFVWLVEWPERGSGHIPPADLAISLAAGASAHQINLTGATPLGVSWLSALQRGG
jgi:tRNA threonylcarbamoyladenosine biosynthesis protein TsaE